MRCCWRFKCFLNDRQAKYGLTKKWLKCGKFSVTRGYLCSIIQFDFIIALCAAEHVLSNTVALLNMLQGKHVDMIEAANESVVVINRRPKRAK